MLPVGPLADRLRQSPAGLRESASFSHLASGNEANEQQNGSFSICRGNFDAVICGWFSTNCYWFCCVPHHLPSLVPFGSVTGTLEVLTVFISYRPNQHSHQPKALHTLTTASASSWSCMKMPFMSFLHVFLRPSLAHHRTLTPDLVSSTVEPQTGRT